MTMKHRQIYAHSARVPLPFDMAVIDVVCSAGLGVAA
jgi:hypothetical protein